MDFGVYHILQQGLINFMVDALFPLVLTFHQGKQHSVVCSISVPFQVLERVVQGLLRDRESFLH